MRKQSRFFLLLTLLLSAFYTDAQYRPNQKHGLYALTFPGFLIGHTDYMANMEAHTLGVEIGYKSNTSGNSYIDSFFSKPRWGVSLFYNYLGNPNLNGHVIALIPHLEIQLRSGKKSATYFRVGTGVGYFNRPFDIYSNKRNKAIGSHFNGSMQGMLTHYLKINNQWEFISGIGLTHFSNGNFTKPNLGINTPHINFGFIKNIGADYNATISQSGFINGKDMENGLEFRFSAAREQVTVIDPKLIAIYVGSVTYYKAINPVRNWRLGTDFFYDRSNPYVVFTPDSDKNRKLSEIAEWGLRSGHEWMFGKVSIVTEMGVYLYMPDRVKRRTYIGVGVNFFPSRKWFVGNRLKTHLATADYFEWGGGYRWAASFLNKGGKK